MRFLWVLASALVCTLAAAADGTLLVVNRAGGSVSLIDLPTTTEIARLPIGPVIPHELATSRDGRWAVTGEYGTRDRPGRHLVVIDIDAASIRSRIDLGPDSRPHSVVFLRDNRHVIATMELSEAIALVDIIDGEVVRTWPTGGVDSHMVRLAPDERHAYVAARGGRGTLSVIWLDEERAPVVIETGAGAEGIAVSPAGDEIWVANRGSETVSVVDAGTLDIIGTIPVAPTNRIEFLPGGQAVIPNGTNADGSLRYVDFFSGDTKQRTRRVSVAGAAESGTGIRLLAADDRLFLADSATDSILVVEPGADDAPQRVMMSPDNPDGMAWSPRRIAVLGNAK